MFLSPPSSFPFFHSLENQWRKKYPWVKIDQKKRERELHTIALCSQVPSLRIQSIVIFSANPRALPLPSAFPLSPPMSPWFKLIHLGTKSSSFIVFSQMTHCVKPFISLKDPRVPHSFLPIVLVLPPLSLFSLPLHTTPNPPPLVSSEWFHQVPGPSVSALYP